MKETTLAALVMFMVFYLALLGVSAITGVSHHLLCSIVFGAFIFMLFKKIGEED